VRPHVGADREVSLQPAASGLRMSFHARTPELATFARNPWRREQEAANGGLVKSKRTKISPNNQAE